MSKQAGGDDVFAFGGSFEAEPAAVIVSEDHAGDEPLLDAIKQARDAGASIELIATSSAEESDRVLGELSGSKIKTAIAAGGDGTLHGTAANWAKEHAPDLCLGVLPLGTGNDFATAAGIPSDNLALALRIALAAPAVEIDLGFANDRPFINVATIGSPAELSVEIDQDLKKRFGRLAYACFGLMKIGQARIVEAEVVADDWRWEGPCLGVMVANGRETGGGFTVASHGLLNDGKLDGLIVPQMPIHEWIMLAIDMRADRVEPALDGVPAWQSGQTTLRFSEPVQVNLDGEPMQAEQVSLRVRPRAIRMRLPADAPTR